MSISGCPGFRRVSSTPRPNSNGSSPFHHCCVRLRFAEAPERTRVELEHRNIDRHGPDGRPCARGSTTKPVGHRTCSAMRRCSTDEPDADSTNRVAATPL